MLIGVALKTILVVAVLKPIFVLQTRGGSRAKAAKKRHFMILDQNSSRPIFKNCSFGHVFRMLQLAADSHRANNRIYKRKGAAAAKTGRTAFGGGRD